MTRFIDDHPIGIALVLMGLIMLAFGLFVDHAEPDPDDPG